MYWFKCLLIIFVFIGITPTNTYGEEMCSVSGDNRWEWTAQSETSLLETPGDIVPLPLFHGTLMSNCDTVASFLKSQTHPLFYLKNHKPTRHSSDLSVYLHTAAGIHIHTILYYVYALEKIVI